MILSCGTVARDSWSAPSYTYGVSYPIFPVKTPHVAVQWPVQWPTSSRAGHSGLVQGSPASGLNAGSMRTMPCGWLRPSPQIRTSRSTLDVSEATRRERRSVLQDFMGPRISQTWRALAPGNRSTNRVSLGDTPRPSPAADPTVPLDGPRSSVSARGLDVWSWLVAQHCSRCPRPDPRVGRSAPSSRPSHFPRPRPLRSLVAQPSRRALQLGSDDGAIASVCPNARAAGSSGRIDHLYIGSELPCAGELAPRPLEAVLRVVMRALIQTRHCVDVTVEKRSHVPLCLRLTASGRHQPRRDPCPACKCPGHHLRPRGPAWYQSSPTLLRLHPAMSTSCEHMV